MKLRYLVVFAFVLPLAMFAQEFRGAIGGVLRAVTDNATAMRETAKSITKVAADANGRAVAAASAT